MDKAWVEDLVLEAQSVGQSLDPAATEKLSRYVDHLLKWNSHVNLTRITEPVAVRVKHLVDSLAGLAVLPAGPLRVLDLGAGAGLPGIPWLIARADLQVTLVDAVAKKVVFLKTALAQLQLSPRGKALQARVMGDPLAESIEPADVVVARAFTALPEMLSLARPYVARAGSVVAMLGVREGESEARETILRQGYDVAELRHLELPKRMGKRLLVRAVPRGT